MWDVKRGIFVVEEADGSNIKQSSTANEVSKMFTKAMKFVDSLYNIIFQRMLESKESGAHMFK